MQDIIVFEWHDFEASIYQQLGLGWNAEFVPDKFNLDKAKGHKVVSVFVQSQIADSELQELKQSGCEIIAIRAAGFDKVNAEFAKSIGLKVFRVASYSPESVAEHVFALLLSLARKLNVERHKQEHLDQHLTIQSLGMVLKGKKLGLYGMGRIGKEVVRIALGFGMQVFFVDPFVNEYAGAQKLNDLKQLFADMDIVSVHVPAIPETKESVNADVLAVSTKPIILINVSRGIILQDDAVVAALDSGRISALGVDVWHDGQVEDKFDSRLIRDNVVQTDHIAFLTAEAVTEILRQTEENIAGAARQENVL